MQQTIKSCIRSVFTSLLPIYFAGLNIFDNLVSCTLLFVLNIVCCWCLWAIDQTWSTRAMNESLYCSFSFLYHFISPLLSVSDLIVLLFSVSLLFLLQVFCLLSICLSQGLMVNLETCSNLSHTSYRLFLTHTHIPVFLLNLFHFSCLILLLITRVISRFILHTENHFPLYPLQRKQTHPSPISQISASLCKSHNAP